MRWKRQKNSITKERKSGVVTTKQTVVRISSVTRKYESRKKNMVGRKNDVACTIAQIIQIKNALSRRVAVNVKTILLLMVEIAKNMKPML